MATKQCLCCWAVDKNKNKTKNKVKGGDGVRRKLVVVGDQGAGKTCLLFRFQDRHSSTDYVPTVFESYAMDFFHKDQKVELVLSDTAGEEEYAGLRQLSYRDADAVIICFALDDPTSLYSVLYKWAPEVSEFCGDLPVVVVGTKKERRDHISHHKPGLHKVAITYESGQEVAKRMGAAAYVECSARSGLGVLEVFAAAVDAIDSAKDNNNANKSRKT